MQVSDLHFRINKEQRTQQNALLGGLLVVLMSVVTAAVGPQLLYEYVLKAAAVEQQMMILQYFPLVTYGLGAVFFLNGMWRWYVGGRRIRAYEHELQLMHYTGLDMMEVNEAAVPGAIAAPVVATPVKRTRVGRKSTVGRAKKK